MWSLAKIAAHIKGEVIGDANFEVTSFATLRSAQEDQISFLSNTKYKKYFSDTDAGAVIVSEEFVDLVPNNAIVVDDSYVAYAKAATLLNPTHTIELGVDNSAVVAENVNIPDSASIGPQVVIESDVVLGENVVIGPGCIIQRACHIDANTRLIANVTLCHDVEIGQDVIIHPGVVIGADGFGIANNKGRWIKIPQIGGVKIGNNVEIGSNTTIDRGALEDTIIGNGVKLDNQIQVGHNTVIGENTVIAGCVGIAGSTIIGKNCAIGGGAGLGGHLELVDGVQLTGMTMVTKSISEPGVYSSGIPAEPTQLWHKNVVRYRQMSKLTDRVKELEKLISKK